MYISPIIFLLPNLYDKYIMHLSENEAISKTFKH